jgi:hypothetical protein
MIGFCKYCGFVGTNDQMMGHAGNCPPDGEPDTVEENGSSHNIKSCYSCDRFEFNKPCDFRHLQTDGKCWVALNTNKENNSSTNSLQQLKADIAALADRLYQLNVGSRATRQDIDDIIRLRQLSAV